MDLLLSQKVAIVTGSSRGLGLAAASALVEEGARVVVCARGKAALDAAAVSLERQAGRKDAVVAVEADVATEAGAEAIVRAATDRFGRIDILVNNVGKA